MKKISTLLFCLTLLAGGLRGQIITTIAGNGTFVYSGDGGPATAAGLSNMAGVTADIYGNAYHVESGRVRITNPAGIINTFAGGSTLTGDGVPATNAFLSPLGLASDASGNIYIIDGCRVRKVNRAGIISTVAGNGGCGNAGDGLPATSAQLYNPLSIALDWEGNIYAGCTYNIRKIDTNGIISTIAGGTTGSFSGDGGPATAAMFNVIHDVATDLHGNLYIGDAGNLRVRKINAAGIISTFAGNGTTGFSGDGGPATAASIGSSGGVSVDNYGHIFISSDGHKIRRIDSDNIITTIAGDGYAGITGDGGPATAARFNAPWHLYAFNNIYVSDLGNRRVRMITGSNAPPFFTHGHVQSVIVCPEIFPLDSLLQVMDADTGQLMRWTLITPPAHGAASAYYTANSTGAVITPTGLVYTHGTGFTGNDTIRVRVTDGVRCDTTTICMLVECPSEIYWSAPYDEIVLSPNPNKGSFVLDLPEIIGTAHIVVSNTLGQTIKEINTTDRHSSITLDAPPGVYSVRVNADGKSWSKKVIIN